MINWQSILSSFNDKPTLLEWLKKVQKALNESALTTVTVSQEKAGRVNSITLSFNFQDGTKIVAPAFTIQDGKDGEGITDLVANNLTNRIHFVTYDTTDGIHVYSEQLSEYTNNEYINRLEFRVPLMPGDGIVIDKRANSEEIEIKVDPSAVISAKGFVTYDSTGNRSFLYPDNLQYWDKEDNQYTFLFPPESGKLTTDNSFKTLFGNKNIVGSGNIDLFVHNIKFKATNTETTIRLIVVSSKNVVVDSLTDLKTLLGNTFEYPCSGADSNGTAILFVKDNGYRTATDIAKEEYTFYPAGTWTDNVATV